MQENSFEELRKNVRHDLTVAMINGLEDGALRTEDAKQSADLILTHLNSATSLDAVLALLESLSARWSVYDTVLSSFKEKYQAQEDTKKIQSLQSKLSKFIH